MLALHLDLKRSMYRPGYFTTIVKRAARLGFDAILLEFEDKIHIDALARAVHPDAWGPRELRGFLGLCSRHGLAVIPKMPVLSHLEWWLQWPWWRYLREDNCISELCPLHPETAPLVRHLVGEVLRLFPDAPAVCLAGDEVFFLGACPRCKQDGRSPAQLYLHHYLPVIDQVETAGKRVILYGDMMLGVPEILDGIPRSVLVADWEYQAGTADEALVWHFRKGEIGSYLKSPDELRKLPTKLRRYRPWFTDEAGRFVAFPYCRYLKTNGYGALALPATKCLGANYCAPKTIKQSVNCMTASRCCRDYGIEGVLITSWAVRMNHLETNWPILAAGAWSYTDPAMTLQEASRRFARQWFGLDTPELFDVVDPLGVCLPDTRYGHNMWPTPQVVRKCLEYVFADPASQACKEVETMLPEARKGYMRARRQLYRLAARVRRNRAMFEHWLLAADTLVHKADSLGMLMRVAQGKKPGPGRARFVRDMDDLAQRHKRLFSRTLTPASVDMEVRVRFEENRELLTR